MCRKLQVQLQGICCALVLGTLTMPGAAFPHGGGAHLVPAYQLAVPVVLAPTYHVTPALVATPTFQHHHHHHPHHHEPAVVIGSAPVNTYAYASAVAGSGASTIA